MKYALHDTEVNKIVCHNDGIELCFDKGVYLLNETGREESLSGSCRMVIKIADFDNQKMYAHIQVMKLKNSKISFLDYEDFIKLLGKNLFRIDIDYYSYFGASVLLKGYCGKLGIELTISEVEKVDYIFGE